MEILLIEDGLLDARLAVKALRKVPFRFRVTLLRDGEEALDFLNAVGVFAQAPRPDVILLDLVLPKRDGLEILAALRGNPETAKIPVVVLTASDSADDRTRCGTFDAVHFITKPVNLQKFLKVIEDLEEHWHQDIILPFEKSVATPPACP